MHLFCRYEIHGSNEADGADFMLPVYLKERKYEYT